MKDLLKTLETQRWDDHRYYHHSRVNQSLHFVSALSFLVAYALLFVDPVAASLVAWLVAMTTRQTGHYIFEPKGYDHVNQATHEHKEAIKVGYNLRRKTVLITLWAACPLVAWALPDVALLRDALPGENAWLRRTGELWLWLGLGGLLFRTVHLFVIRDVATGLTWLLKILTDPFHDLKLYHRAPLHLLRGEWFDPMTHARPR